jgi:hypothetical protein
VIGALHYPDKLYTIIHDQAFHIAHIARHTQQYIRLVINIDLMVNNIEMIRSFTTCITLGACKNLTELPCAFRCDL